MGQSIIGGGGGGGGGDSGAQERILRAQEEQLDAARAERERQEKERAGRQRRLRGARQGLSQLAFAGDTGTLQSKLGAGSRG